MEELISKYKYDEKYVDFDKYRHKCLCEVIKCLCRNHDYKCLCEIVKCLCRNHDYKCLCEIIKCLCSIDYKCAACDNY
jgi:hypothetical protein